LQRLLQLLKAAAEPRVQDLGSPRGRRKNIALANLVIHAADFWEMDLKRRFRIDYHKGAGLTPGFDFVKALLKPIDHVTDRQIITAMRTEIKLRRVPVLQKRRAR
jgi:hypothetical protein